MRQKRMRAGLELPYPHFHLFLHRQEEDSTSLLKRKGSCWIKIRVSELTPPCREAVEERQYTARATPDQHTHIRLLHQLQLTAAIFTVELH